MSLSNFDVWINLSSPIKWRKLSLSVPGVEGLSPKGMPSVFIDHNNAILISYVEEYEEGEPPVIKYRIQFIYSLTAGNIWSEPKLVVSDVDLGNPAIIVDYTNRIFVYYLLGDKPYQCYSSDFGQTWEGFSEIKED
jgi:hypothetical protein